MKHAALLLFALAGLTAAEEARPQNAAPAAPAAEVAAPKGMPWLGLTVGRLDDAIRAQVPALPPGIGFVITSVEAGSPAEKAGVRPYDILWKLGDQWIANEAQLFTLLRLRKAGEETKLAVYRSGTSLDLPVTLGRLPDNHLRGKMPALAAGEFPDVPMKVLNPDGSSAKIEAGDGSAILTISKGIKEVKIVSSDGSVIYQGPLNDAAGVSLVPDPWKIRVITLERTLARRLAAPPVQRQPRLRLATQDPVDAKE
jgi:hypothetical protein